MKFPITFKYNIYTKSSNKERTERREDLSHKYPRVCFWGKRLTKKGQLLFENNNNERNKIIAFNMHQTEFHFFLLLFSFHLKSVHFVH